MCRSWFRTECIDRQQKRAPIASAGIRIDSSAIQVADTGGDNVTALSDSIVELPDDEKLTLFAPQDLGWPSDLIASSDPLEV